MAYDLEHPDITYARATGEDPTEPRTVRACTCDVCGEDIGDSVYRICKTDATHGTGKWYIHENYNDGSTFAGANAYYSDDLATVIERLNSFTAEKEVINLDRGQR